MCWPIAVMLPYIAAAASAAAAVASSVQQTRNQNEMAKRTELAANLNFANETNIANRQATEIDRAQAEDKFSMIVANAQAQGQISASAATSGLGRSTIQQIANADAVARGREAAINKSNYTSQRLGLTDEQFGRALTRTATIAGAPKGSMTQAWVLGVGSGVAAGGSAYTGTGGKF